MIWFTPVPYIAITALIPILMMSLLASVFATGVTVVLFLLEIIARMLMHPQELELLVVISISVAMVSVILLVAAFVRLRVQQNLMRRTAALEKSETRFREVIEIGLDTFFLFESVRDTQGRIVDFTVADLNTSAEKINNLQRDEIIGKSVRHLYPDLEVLGLFEQYVQVAHTRKPITREIQITEPPVLAGWYRYTISPVGDGVAIISRNITLGKTMENELRESERRFRSLAENSPDTIYILDLKTGTAIYKNYVEFLGYTDKDLRAEDSLLGRLHAEDRRRVVHHWHQTIHDKSGATRQIEYRVLTKQNEWAWVQSRETVIGRDEDGTPQQILVTLSIVTERKNAEMALRQSEERFKAQYKGIPIPTLTWQRVDGQFTLVDYNDTANAFFDDRLVYYLGENIDEAHPEIPVSHEDLEACFSGGAIMRQSVTAPLRNRGERHLHMAFAFVPPDLVMIHMEDMTDVRAAEAQRVALAVERKRVELLQSFIGDVSHDLMTPLTIMKTGLYLLTKDTTDAQRQDRIEKLETQVDHLEKMIRDMLTLSALDANLENSFDLREQDLNVNTAAVVTEYQAMAAEKQQTMIFEHAEPLPSVLLDVYQFRRAMMNLVSNAVKYTSAGGHVTVTTGKVITQGRTEVFVTVRDTGEGIAPEVLPHIFDRFYRGDNHRPMDGGSGLGLAIARKIIEAHHGRIEVESELKQGTVFRVFLPVIDSTETQENSTIPVKTAASTGDD